MSVALRLPLEVLLSPSGQGLTVAWREMSVKRNSDVSKALLIGLINERMSANHSFIPIVSENFAALKCVKLDAFSKSTRSLGPSPILLAESEISNSSFRQVILPFSRSCFASQGPEKTLSFVLNQLLKVVSQQGLVSVDMGRCERVTMRKLSSS
jgi:hypothetical protein